ncbi:MAG: hypothetical protein GWN79_07265, partial [Actinobacteria bacterium]|nr:hypothetical protein [Actinomycetota bacterium]NIS30669.1 hypothetical protein [Actinomycetota bacterium]NIT95221.1 hypothetical protein [Actinomycetota bacterium]NIU18900.1 hypothetical protein [Actinomycetota bacterium]NIU65881.1 hypothetical protein [Actinomycetota bacterium]
VDAEDLRRAAAKAGRSAKPHATVVTTLHAVDIDDAEDAVAFGFSLGQYRYDRYFTSDDGAAATERLVLAGAGAD